MASPLNGMVDASVRCSKCGTPGMFQCGCYVQCSCGWIAERGKPCRNPETMDCSTKLKYAPATFAPRKGDRVVMKYRTACEVGYLPCDAVLSSEGYCGTVAATPRAERGTVSVRWDGRASCERVRIGWLEKAPA